MPALVHRSRLTASIAALVLAIGAAGCAPSAASNAPATTAPASAPTSSAGRAEPHRPGVGGADSRRLPRHAEPRLRVDDDRGSAGTDRHDRLGVAGRGRRARDGPRRLGDFTWGSVDKHLPWFKDRVEELGGPLPEIIRYTDTFEVDFEQVLGLDPDLILALHTGLTDTEYARLSEIAPTVAYKDRAWTSDWKELTHTVGLAMGQVEAADALVADTEAEIARSAAAHPEFAGRTFTYGWYLSDGATALDLYVPEDPRVQLIEQLGFVTSPQVVELSKSASEFYVSVSLEKLETVESDFHLAWVDNDADLTRTLDNALVAQWAPIQATSYYFMEDQALAWASSQPSVLSIPWQLELITKAIAEALVPAS